MKETRSRLRSILPCLFLPAAVLIPRAGLRSAEWVGRTREALDSPEACGLTRPRLLPSPEPYEISLDLDRDGDSDLVKVYRGSREGLIETLSRQSTERLVSVWKTNLSPRTAGTVTGVYTARLKEEKWPSLVVEVSASPYLAVFSGRGNGAFSLQPAWLSRRFPVRYYFKRDRVEPYISVVGIQDWNGDGFEDILTLVLDAALDLHGKLKVHRHGLYALFGGPKWPQSAVELLDLTKLGASVRPLAVDDFDGDGTIELLLETERLRGGSVRVSELIFLRKDKEIVQEASWPLTETALTPYFSRDLNGDGIPDVILADYSRNHFLILETDRRRGRGFAFDLRRIIFPRDAYPDEEAEVSLFVENLDGKGLLDFFTVSRRHNQVRLVFPVAGGKAKTRTVFLPPLSHAVDREGTGWFRKALWYGDADGDGTKELLVVTNQPMDPSFDLSSLSGASPDEAIRSLLRPGAEKTAFAPYFRLLVYRLKGEKISLAAKLNTFIAARGMSPERTIFRSRETAPVPRIIIEVANRKTGRAVQSAFGVTKRLPSAR